MRQECTIIVLAKFLHNLIIFAVSLKYFPFFSLIPKYFYMLDLLVCTILFLFRSLLLYERKKGDNFKLY